MGKDYRRFVWLSTLLLAMILGIKIGPSMPAKGAAAGLLVVVGYYTGVLAMVVGSLIYLLSAIVAIPPFSFIVAAVAAALAKIHFIIFNVLLGRAIKRTAAYEATGRRIRESRIYRRADSLVSGIFSRAGLKEARKMKLIEVARCGACGREMPSDGAYCTYCGVKT